MIVFVGLGVIMRVADSPLCQLVRLPTSWYVCLVFREVGAAWIPTSCPAGNRRLFAAGSRYRFWDLQLSREDGTAHIVTGRCVHELDVYPMGLHAHCTVAQTMLARWFRRANRAALMVKRSPRFVGRPKRRVDMASLTACGHSVGIVQIGVYVRRFVAP